ncbi:MAG: YihY/virulence factor BrkB family protein [Terracoccus sp.]
MTTQTRHDADTDASRAQRHTGDVEDTDASGKPESPDDMKKPAWRYVLRRTVREFSKDECTDLAAALTYYAVLALFPAVIALLSLLGLVGQSQQTVTTLTSLLNDVGAGGAASTVEPILTSLSTASGSGLLFLVGLASALWSASGYVNSFGRAMNRIYEVREGRPFWKMRPAMLLVTLIAIILVALVALALVLTGPVAESVGSAIGLGSTAVLVWNIAKWPVMLAVVILIIAILYWATPNVKQPKFRWVSVGAVLAIVIWILASAGFGFYVSHFGSYNKTYGALAGVVIFLLWLWITNIALLFGAELDAELERGRELQAGIVAEESIQLDHRDTTKIEKNEAKDADEIERGRELRLTQGGSDGDGDDSQEGERPRGAEHTHHSSKGRADDGT